MAQDWHLAASLVALRTEINRKWPNRDKASDGALGDTSHQARPSDHNPDWDAGGVVRAIDVDKDGIDVQELLNATIRDQRVWYVIWNRKIYSRTYGWAPRAYTGTNPHDKHVHISIQHTSAAERDTSAWFTAMEEEISVSAEANIIRQVNAVSAHLQLNAAQNRQTLTKDIGELLKLSQEGQTEQLATYLRQMDALNDQAVAELQAKVDALKVEDEPEEPVTP